MAFSQAGNASSSITLLRTLSFLLIILEFTINTKGMASNRLQKGYFLFWANDTGFPLTELVRFILKVNLIEYISLFFQVHLIIV